MEDKNKKPGTPQNQGRQGKSGTPQQTTNTGRNKDLSKEQQRKVSSDKNLETERTDQPEVPDVNKQEKGQQDKNLKR